MKPRALLAFGLLLPQMVVAAPKTPSIAPPIAPPFGLSWVETPSQIKQLIERSQVRLVQKETVDKRESWTVQGFDQPYLNAVVFYFIGDALDEVELQYHDPSWTLGQYGELMEQIKAELERKYGRSEVLARTRDQEKGVSQTMLGYRWQSQDQALDLVFYGAEHEPLAFRLLSMHYKQAHP